jgi:Ca2+-binding RTX toxin-like protein
MTKTAAPLLALGALLLLTATAVSAGASPPTFACADIGAKPEPATIMGTNGNDVITGTAGRDVIVALGGSDSIDGGGGNDLICGGDGNDKIAGGAGQDVISGDAGDDVIDGGTQPRGGQDFAEYDVSPVAVKASLAAGTVSGWGSDRLTRIEGISGSRFADSLTGDRRDNVLIGQRGNDVLNGLADVDILTGSEGNDVLDGGGGPDLALYQQAPHAISADLRKGTASGWGRDRLRSIEDVVGSRRADRLLGGNGPNYMWGLGGADLLDGRGGRDRGFGGAGRDRCLHVEVRLSC